MTKIYKLFIELEVDADTYALDNEEEEQWLLRILLNGSTSDRNTLMLFSQEIGDFVGDVKVSKLEQ